MSKSLTLHKRRGGYKVYYHNGCLVGEFLISEDGYYNWWPTDRPGYLTSNNLKEIAKELDELNREWDADVRQKLKELDPEYIKLCDDKFWELIDE